MIAPRIVSLVAALVLTSPAALFSQEQATVAPGDRVRVTAPTEHSDRFVGTVVEIGADTCVLDVEGRAEPLVLPLAAVTRFEVSRGKKSRVGMGALVGGLTGAALGTIGAGSWGGGWGGESGFGSDAGYIIAGSVVVGAGVGAIIGAVSRTERWEVVDLQSVRVGLTPLGKRRLALSVSVAF